MQMPERIRSGTRTVQESRHGMRLVPMFEHRRLVNSEAIGEALQQHGLPKITVDSPIIHASDLPTPSTVTEAKVSEPAKIMRDYGVGEFGGLLQAHTFAPV